MQLFVTSPDPAKCAEYLDNRRLNKQILECAQILSTVMWLLGEEETPYKPTHKHHPIVQSVAADHNLIQWVLRFMYECKNEYYIRRSKIHKCEQVFDHFVRWCLSIRYTKYLLEAKDFYDCSGESGPNVFDNYKLCLAKKWATDKVKPKWRAT